MTDQSKKRSTNKLEMYVLQDGRSHADNQLLFWAKDAKGYTTDINKAHLFTKEEAMQQQAQRGTDKPYKLADIKAVIAATVDRDVLRHHQQSKQGQSTEAKTQPQVWAYQNSNNEDGRPLITTNRAITLPEGWSEMEVTELATKPTSAVTATRLHEWADDFDAAAKDAPTRLQGTVLMTRSAEAREAALAMQARQAMDIEIRTLARQSSGAGESVALVPPETLMQWSKTFSKTASVSVDDAQKFALQGCAADCQEVAAMVAEGVTVDTRFQGAYDSNEPLPAPLTADRLHLWGDEFEKAADRAITNDQSAELNSCGYDCHQLAGQLSQQDQDLSDGDSPGQ